MNHANLAADLMAQVERELTALIGASDTRQLETLQRQAADNGQYPDLRYRLANLYFLRGEMDAALAELDAATAINPDFEEATSLKAAIFSSQGRLEDALELYRRLCQARPNDAETHYLCATAMSRLGRVDDAIVFASRCLELDPRHEQAHALLAERYLQEQSWDLAAAHYEKALEIRPREDNYYVLALLRLRVGDVDRAEQLLEQAIELMPGHLNSCLRLAILKIAEGELDRAYGLLRRTLANHPTYADLRVSLAKVCMLMGKQQEAHELMNAALEINPRYAEARREMGYLFSARNMKQEAAEQLQQSLEIDPDDEQARVNLAFLYSNQGDHEQAIEVLAAAIQKSPDSWRLHQSLGVVHLQERAFPKARLMFDNALRINPDIEAAQRSLRIVYQDESLFDEERDRLLKMYAAEEVRPELDHHLGVLHLDFHKDKMAISYFQRSHAAGYRPIVNGILLATVHANVQNLDGAIKALFDVKAVGIEEQIRRTLLALFYANMGDHDPSARAYQQVMTEAPLFFHALNGLTVSFREREELDDMLDDYLDYARFQERTAPLYCRIGALHANKGLLVEARQHFFHATILDPSDARAYQALGVLAMLRLDFAVAIDYFLKSAEHQPDWSMPHLNLAILYLSQERTSLASVSLRRFIRLEGPGAWRNLASELAEGLRDSGSPPTLVRRAAPAPAAPVAN